MLSGECRPHHLPLAGLQSFETWPQLLSQHLCHSLCTRPSSNVQWCSHEDHMPFISSTRAVAVCCLGTHSTAKLNGQSLCTNTWRGWFSRESWLSSRLKCLPFHTHDLVRRQATTTKKLLVGQNLLAPLSRINLCSEYHSSWLNTHTPHHITCTHTYYMQTYIRTHAHTHAHMCFIPSIEN